MVMTLDQGWSGILVAPPSPYAGIGGALRHAFGMENVGRTNERFAELLARLDRLSVRERR